MKYFQDESSALAWASSKLQALVRSKNERKKVERKRKDIEEARRLLVDPNNVKVMSERQATVGYEELQVLVS